MGFYFAEVRKLRRELQAAYGAGEYKKALILGKNILQKYLENDDANTMEYASDMHNLGLSSTPWVCMPRRWNITRKRQY